MVAVFVAVLATVLLFAPATEQRLLHQNRDVGSGDSPVDDDDFSGSMPLTNVMPKVGDDDEGSGGVPVMTTTNVAVTSIRSLTNRGSSTSTSTTGLIRGSTGAHQDRPGLESFIDIDGTSAIQPQQRPATSSSSKAPAVHHHTPPAAARLTQSTSVLNNAVPNVPTVLPTIDETKEEGSNSIAGAGFAVAQSRMSSRPDHQGLHPGLLAAVIGGGVVGLLSAILLVMFVVYRLRKKDEGGYTTVDAKPRLNTYTRASSREFYA